MKCAVIAFPGNNCETETARAATRNGFEAQIFRWNQIEDFEAFDPEFIILPGGFSFEDRGRAGALASKEPIFDSIRIQAKQGKIILGICNGAQMIIESALIPAEIALAKNVRRNAQGHVMGVGYYNEWVHLCPARKDTAFTQYLDQNILKVPIAHGEGRFMSQDKEAMDHLKKDDLVAFRYCDEAGKVDAHFPVTPNGAAFATAAMTNAEGTIMAMMPHPERFFEDFDGDAIFKSVAQFIEAGKGPKVVKIGIFEELPTPAVTAFKQEKSTLYLEKKLIITDNENFSVSAAAQNIVGAECDMTKSTLYAIKGAGVEALSDKILATGLIYNPSKEFLCEEGATGQVLAVLPYEDDEAEYLAEHLSEILGTMVTVHIYTNWHFGNKAPAGAITTLIGSRLLANPNSAQLFKK